MTKTYCTACACQDKEEKKGRALPKCLHPANKNGNKLNCPLKIKYTLTPDNSFTFKIYQIPSEPPVNMVYYG